MTREEAITIIDNLHLIGCGHNQHEDDLKINVALDMAIKALEDIERWRTWSHTYDDLISRQNAIKGVKELFACADVGNDECDITYMLETLPTIDAVEVVRCKDCKYAHMTYGGECKYCDMWEEDGEDGEVLYLDGDFFCAYGERREDGEA